MATPERVHLEHIYPQRSDAENKWANHDEYIGRVANLTLLSKKLNIEAQNLPFAEKKERFYTQSELYLTQELLAIDHWTPAEIDGRQARLCELVIETWPRNLVDN
jgi:hypothetical protein